MADRHRSAHRATKPARDKSKRMGYKVFDEPEKLIDAIDAWAKDRQENNKPMGMANLIKDLGYKSRVVFENMAVESPEWKAAVEYGQLVVEAWLEHDLLSKKSGHVGNIFALKALDPARYSDKAQIETLNRNLNLNADRTVTDVVDMRVLAAKLKAQMEERQLLAEETKGAGTVIDGEAKRLGESNVSQQQILKRTLKRTTTKELPFAEEGDTQGIEEWML